MNEMSSEYMLITLDDELPEMPEFEPGIRRAPSRGFHLTEEQTKTALKNALRYIKPEYHKQLIRNSWMNCIQKDVFMDIVSVRQDVSMESRLTNTRENVSREKRFRS